MNFTRRSFAAGLTGAGMMTEALYAQRAAIQGPIAKDMVWLNANENPDGPPAVSIEAMTKCLKSTGRYHYQEFREFYAAVAKSEDLAPEQILIGSGSSEVLHAAIDAFVTPERPLIPIVPTYEGPIDVARAKGLPITGVPLTDRYTADVKNLVATADKAKGGVIYLCNPNNPTGAVTPKADMAWLVANLPKNTYLVADEAYWPFADSPDFESILPAVRQGKNVIVTRTYSKIHGMAGLRAGYACAAPELIAKMAPFRNNVISYVAVQAVLAAVADPASFLPQRKASVIKLRNETLGWLRGKGFSVIDSQANFFMFDLKREARPIIQAMPAKGVAVGRPFPPYNTMMRVSIGTAADMAKFRDVFTSVYGA